MLTSGFRRAFANVSRFGSSSERVDQTDESSRKDKQKDSSPGPLVSEEGIVYHTTSTSNPWGERTLSTRGKQMLEVEQQTEKHLPRIPVQPDEATSQTGLFEGIPHITSTVADSLKENLEPLVVDSDKVSSGLLLDKLATDDSSFKDDIFPNPSSLEDRGHTSQRRTFLDRRLVALSVAESSISSSSDDLAKQFISPADADSSEQTRKTASDSRELPLELEISQTTPNLTLQDVQRPKPISEPDSNKQELDPSRSQRSKSSFPSFLHKLATVPNLEPITNTSSSSTQRTAAQYHPLSTDLPPPRFADHLEISTDIQPPDFIPTSTSNSTSLSPSSLPSSPSNDDQEKKSRRKRPQNTFLMLQPIVESGNNFSPPPPKPSSSGFTPSTLGVDSSFAKRMEETGRLRRLQSQKNIAPNDTGLKPLVLSPNPSQSSLTPGKPALNGSTHPKIRSEGDVLSPLSASSVPPSFKAVQTKVNELSQSDDQDALHEFLERTLRELEEIQREAALVKVESNLDKIRLEEQLKDANEEVVALRKENELQKKEIATFEKQLKNKERDVLRLFMEKQNWQEQLDTMHHRLNQAERQMRCLDHLTRSKVEARVEGVYGPTRRAKLSSPIKEPSVEVMGALSALNEEILQSANLLVENLERTKSTHPTSDDTTLARTMLGSKVTTMIQAQANDRSKAFRFLLMQVVLEVFMVNWCTSIIEGWYPKQQSFTDLLIEMNSKVVTSSTPRVDCGKVKIIQTNTSTTLPVRFPEWAADILQDLGSILLVAGLKMRPNRTSLFTSKLLSLVKMAYDVRTALAEKDICGDLDLSVIGPDMPFQPKWMEEAHAMTRHQLGTTMRMEPIAGTCGMGLKRVEVKKDAASQQDQIVVLKPRVVLARVLDESP